ncbi:MAG: hypothetical protein ACRCWJ_06540 [Casimicrobium sp.]
MTKLDAATVARALREASEDQLVEALKVHRRESDDTRPKFYCEECTNFKPDAILAARKTTFNPCAKGHPMRFRQPQGYNDDYGFYRNTCSDRNLVGDDKTHA